MCVCLQFVSILQHLLFFPEISAFLQHFQRCSILSLTKRGPFFPMTNSFLSLFPFFTSSLHASLPSSSFKWLIKAFELSAHMLSLKADMSATLLLLNLLYLFGSFCFYFVKLCSSLSVLSSRCLSSFKAICFAKLFHAFIRVAKARMQARKWKERVEKLFSKLKTSNIRNFFIFSSRQLNTSRRAQNILTKNTDMSLRFARETKVKDVDRSSFALKANVFSFLTHHFEPKCLPDIFAVQVQKGVCRYMLTFEKFVFAQVSQTFFATLGGFAGRGPLCLDFKMQCNSKYMIKKNKLPFFLRCDFGS